MIRTILDLNPEGKLYDHLAGEKVRLEEFTARIEFPAPYAHYAFTSHGRDVLNDAMRKRDGDVRKDFIDHYDKNLLVPGALNYATRNLLNELRRYELKAPGPRPPAQNIFRHRLRRITGRLADTAYIPRQTTKIEAAEERDRRTQKNRAKIIRRRKRSRTAGLAGGRLGIWRG